MVRFHRTMEDLKRDGVEEERLTRRARTGFRINGMNTLRTFVVLFQEMYVTAYD